MTRTCVVRVSAFFTAVFQHQYCTQPYRMYNGRYNTMQCGEMCISDILELFFCGFSFPTIGSLVDSERFAEHVRPCCCLMLR